WRRRENERRLVRRDSLRIGGCPPFDRKTKKSLKGGVLPRRRWIQPLSLPERRLGSRRERVTARRLKFRSLRNPRALSSPSFAPSVPRDAAAPRLPCRAASSCFASRFPESIARR